MSSVPPPAGPARPSDEAPPSAEAERLARRAVAALRSAMLAMWPESSADQYAAWAKTFERAHRTPPAGVTPTQDPAAIVPPATGDTER